MSARRCPYCAEAIEPIAIVCPHCTRDLFFVKPLMDSLDGLSERVAKLEAAAEEAARSRAAEPATPPPEAPGAVAPPPPPKPTRWVVPVLLVLVLIAAHGLLVVLFDVRLVYLRLLSIVLPFAAGFAFRRAIPVSIWVDALVGIAVACVALCGMLWNVARSDGVPMLPVRREEWSETLQYGLSIALGFLSGALLRRVVLLATQPDAAGGVMNRLAHAIAKDIFGDVEDASFEKRLKKIESLITSGVAIGAAVLSALLGLSRFLS